MPSLDWHCSPDFCSNSFSRNGFDNIYNHNNHDFSFSTKTQLNIILYFTPLQLDSDGRVFHFSQKRNMVVAELRLNQMHGVRAMRARDTMANGWMRSKRTVRFGGDGGVAVILFLFV